MVGVLGQGDVQAGTRERTAMAVLRGTEVMTAAVHKARLRCSHVLTTVCQYILGEGREWVRLADSKIVVPREKSRRVRWLWGVYIERVMWKKDASPEVGKVLEKYRWSGSGWVVN